jgi:hypothetical protein
VRRGGVLVVPVVGYNLGKVRMLRGVSSLQWDAESYTALLAKGKEDKIGVRIMNGFKGSTML